ncbi:MAG: hypothetical protein ABI876_15495 [Bacteroidota bacterium]
MNSPPSTDHDLYTAIDNLIANSADAPNLLLEDYLRALLRLSRLHADAEWLLPEEFIALLSRAFVEEAEPYDPAWRESYRRDAEALRGFARFESRLLGQIVDLREMREAGILDQKWAELGVDAPRGGRWFNLAPPLYLECAATAIDRWEKGEVVGNEILPGMVLALAPHTDGNVVERRTEECSIRIHAVEKIAWEQFANFLWFGQIYE